MNKDNVNKRRWLVGTILYFSSIGLWVILLVSFFLWLIPVLFLVYLLGVISTTFTRKAKPWPEFKAHWVWKWFRESYFQFQVKGPGLDYIIQKKEDQKGPSSLREKDRNILYAIYPHGVLPVTTFFYWCVNPDQFPDTITCVHSVVFQIPLIKDVAQWLSLTSVREDDIVGAYKKTTRVAINPGGVGDIGNNSSSNDVCKRHGFLRVAKEMDALVIPIWVPQERSFFSVWKPFGDILVPYLRYPFPLFIWPIFPRKIQTDIMVGNAIDMKEFTVEEGYDQFYNVELKNLQK